MILGISQPTFMPYAGYFGLLDYADCFVFLDNVQFDKRSWQQRNYIFMDKKAYLLTVPVLSKGKFQQKILQGNLEIKYPSFDLPVDHRGAYTISRFSDWIL